MLRFLQLIYFVYAAILFIALLIPVFILSVLASFAGAVLGGNLIYNICTAWATTWFFLVGIRHTNINAKKLEKGKPYIFVANHISYLDAALIVKVIPKPLRPLGKIELGKIPLFGFIYKKAIVSVDRSSPINRARSIDRLKAVLRRDISIFVFPEGTFNETHEPLTDFFSGAFRIAIETGTPIKPIIFLDTYDRLPYDKKLSLNPGKCRALFLDEVPVDGLTDDHVKELSEKVYKMMEAAIIAHKASWVTEK